MKAAYTLLTDLDRQTKMLCLRLMSEKQLEPKQRIELAEQIQMLQQDRAAMVEEIKTICSKAAHDR